MIQLGVTELLRQDLRMLLFELPMAECLCQQFAQQCAGCGQTCLDSTSFYICYLALEALGNVSIPWQFATRPLCCMHDCTNICYVCIIHWALTHTSPTCMVYVLIP